MLSGYYMLYLVAHDHDEIQLKQIIIIFICIWFLMFQMVSKA